MQRLFSKIGILALFTIITLSLFFAPGIPAGNAQESDPKTDGIIEKNEYDGVTTTKNGEFTLYWKIVGEYIYFALVGKTSGWVGIGIDPIGYMKNADMIFGWVTSTEVVAFDAFSEGDFGPHIKDVDLGGEDNIIEFGGKENSSLTIIEVKRPLKASDKYDKAIPINDTVTISWAIGKNGEDNFESMPQSMGQFDLNTTYYEKVVASSFWSELKLRNIMIFVGITAFIFITLVALLIRRIILRRRG